MGQWDASIKLVYAAKKGTDFTLDDVQIGQEFDLVADLEVGTGLQSFGGPYTVYFTVRNLTTQEKVGSVKHTGNIRPKNVPNPFRASVRELFPAAWVADDGDVLDVLAVLQFNPGANNDYSTVRSAEFIAIV